MADADPLKTAPHSLEAEQAVLGGLMLDNEAWDSIADRVCEDDFYLHDHRVIFRAIEELAKANKPYDLVTLSDWLERSKLLSDLPSVLAYLGQLVRETPSAANIAVYADIVRERALQRNLIRVANQIIEDSYSPQGRDAKSLLDEAEQRVFRIAEERGQTGQAFRKLSDLLGKVVTHIEELSERDDPITGLPMGYPDLDEMTSGLQPGDLVIIAGRPSMGKTSFAMNIAQYAAYKRNAAVAVFSMEMPGEQIAMRLLSTLGRIDAHRLRSGKLHDEDWARFTHAIDILQGLPIFVDDSAALSPIEVRARARRLKRQYDLKLIVIDYLQLMQIPGGGENRATEISEISRSLKALAKELKVPVIALSQLNRGLEQRPNKRPVMSDLRESGAIEQDADLIMFIYRDEVYDKDTSEKGIAEIIIAKQRNGPIGMRKLTFLDKYTSFEPYVSEVYSSEHFS